MTNFLTPKNDTSLEHINRALARASPARVAREVEREAAFAPKTRTNAFALGRWQVQSKRGIKKRGSLAASLRILGVRGRSPRRVAETPRIRH